MGFFFLLWVVRIQKCVINCEGFCALNYLQNPEEDAAIRNEDGVFFRTEVVRIEFPHIHNQSSVRANVVNVQVFWYHFFGSVRLRLRDPLAVIPKIF